MPQQGHGQPGAQKAKTRFSWSFNIFYTFQTISLQNVYVYHECYEHYCAD